MNAGMTIATIFSLLLALATAGDAAKHQAGVSDSPAGIRGSNLNHNETLVRDTALVQQSNDWSLWMSDERSFAASVLIQFSMYRPGPGCSPWVCGSNHNETLVRDAAPMK